MKKKLVASLIGAAITTVSVGALATDFGRKIEKLLKEHASKLYGIEAPLYKGFTDNVSREPGQAATDLIKLAPGLKASILTRQVANSVDMLAFWPNDDRPSHLVVCIEGDRETIKDKKLNPSVQRVDIDTGEVETILRGMSSCDGIRRTPWNTILATEEESDGAAYEILEPLETTEHSIIDRSSGAVVNSEGKPATAIARRSALPTMAWEGLDITHEGVVVAGDELRPGTAALDLDGGSIYKFIPATPYDGGEIKTLEDSPLVAGSLYVYTASCVDVESSSFPQYGQGCEVGQGAWLKVDPLTARRDAHAGGATGYYRPEDGHFDPTYRGDGYKFCWTNTGNADAHNYGEVFCMIDEHPLGTGEQTDTQTSRSYLADKAHDKGYAVAHTNRFVEGDSDFNQPDNLAFQPKTGNVYVIEDNENGDIFACLPDGKDRDIKSDGCVRILSVKDQSAEPTGFTFTGDGKTAFVSIQHSDDAACKDDSDCSSHDDYATDDIVMITGWHSGARNKKWWHPHRYHH